MISTKYDMYDAMEKEMIKAKRARIQNPNQF